MKKFFIYFSLAIFTTMGIYVMKVAASLPRTYDGKNTNVYELQQNYEKYDISEADGIANVIIKENLEKTRALNTVASVTFDFRGYDTLGESFILLTAISGSVVILRNSKRGRENSDEEKYKG
jgi:hypothetical protein